MKNEEAESVVSFWTKAGRAKWFTKDAAFDEEIRAKFLPLVEKAAAGQLAHWLETPQSALALIILLDQFPRNLFRGEARAFATDADARRVAREALRRNYAKAIAPDLRPFLYLPFEHSENLVDQDRSAALFRGLGNDDFIKYAEIHRDVIVRFGRFPHRNKALGRAMTPREQAFLDSGGFSV